MRFLLGNQFPYAIGRVISTGIDMSMLFLPLGADGLITSDGFLFKVVINSVPFQPFGSDLLITSNGDVFNVREY